MIRRFEMMDARRLKANEFSAVSDMSFVFHDDSFFKHTLVGPESDIHAIICFKRYWANNWAAFFLISSDMPAISARQLKKFVDDAIIDLRAERVQTDSVDCPELNRWHKFLGFRKEGTREKMIFDRDYNMWCKMKGKDF